MTQTTEDVRNVHRRIRNILDVFPASDWTVEEACGVLDALEQIVWNRR